MTPITVYTEERVALIPGALAANGGNVLLAAKALGVSRGSLSAYLSEHPELRTPAPPAPASAGVVASGPVSGREGEGGRAAVALEPVISLSPPPSGALRTEDLVEDRIRRFELKRAHEEARKLIPVAIRENLPIGILHFGDPHLDDDGTDVRQVRDHLKLLRETPGLYGANVGDATNNWIGRLARLYGQQTTSAAESWQLAEWFIAEGKGKWLYLVGGNHDLWSGAGDPLRWIAAQASALYQDSEVRVALRFPNSQEIRVNCRHDFAGRSQYNPAHGPMKALFFGVRDHLAIAGHTHESAYGLLKDPDSGITMHAVRVASYKTFDRFAREKGFRDQTLSPCALTVLNPRLPATHPDLVKLFWDPVEGADFLTWMRARKAA